MRNTLISFSKTGLVCLLIIAGTLMQTGNVTAQSTDPATLPLLSSGGLEYVGGFRVPAETSNGWSFSYGGQAVAHDPSTNTLFVSSQNGVAEISIPAPVKSSDPSAMPFASFLQGFADPTEGHLRDVYAGDTKMDSLMVYGNRLYGAAYIYFDASNEQRVSHFSRSRQLSQPSFSGWSQVWETGRSGFVGGMMSAVPSEWQSKLGGPAITGQCCIPIVWRTSFGPAAFAFNPSQVGQPAVAGTPLLYYPSDHATLGEWSGSNETYGSTTQILGMAVIAGTRTILYFGRNGMGANCYGAGTADLALVGTAPPGGGEPYCYDPTNSYKGTHAYPYRYQVWAYDLNDFAAVKAGAKQPWEVVPYGVWPLSLPTPEATVRLGGVGYDAVRQLLYISQIGGDPDGYANRPLIHAFHVNAMPGAASTLSNAVSNVTLTADKTAPQAVGTPITLTAQPVGGVSPYQYKWIISNGSSTTIAANWTTNNRFTWTPTTESATYQVTVWVRSAGNAADVLEASANLAFPIGTTATGATTSVDLTANKVASQPPMTAITWSANAKGGTAPHQYKWRIYDGSTWTVGASWSTTNSFIWTPSKSNKNYRVEVWVRGAASTTDSPETSNASAFPIEDVSTASTMSVSLTANRPAPQQMGNAIGFNAVASGGTAPFLYKWFVTTGTTWTAFGDWASSANFSWYPTEANANYRIRVWVKAAGNTADQPEGAAEMPFAITSTATTSPAPTSVASVSLASSKASPQPAGTSIVFNATASGGMSPLFKWFVYDGSVWTATTGWGSATSFTWMPSTSNSNYRIRVWAKSSTNTADQPEAATEQAYSITAVESPVGAVRITSDKASPQGTGTSLIFTATPSGGSAPFVFRWSVNGAPVAGWSSSNTFAWTPTAPDNYRISVAVKRASNPADQGEATDEMRFNINNGKGK